MSPRPVDARDLTSTELFGPCAADAVERLCERGRVRSLQRHQVLFFEGDAVDSLAVVRSGRLKVYSTSSGGDELLLSIADPGETLGELGVLDAEARSATVAAMEASEVVLIPRDDLLRALEADPELSRRLQTRITALARRLTASSTDLAFVDLPRRLAKALVARQAAHNSAEGLALSQSDLASMVGGSRQAVNAALAGFERRGWVTLEAGRVVSLDAAALTKFADS
ncbi:MAG TPA: Crp/Fnr family transcriptional regulator [Mycobacteriales bacterium]|nr:Crp/Fnr family transcriptional regulator [Mycobacteriales bacterium]